MSQTWTVAGMTCSHCVDSVTEEVAELPGVRTVDVVLESGALTVVAEPRLTDDAVRRAVEEAGYRLT
ncbi:MAG: heavy-metal-associated domain-containing protein [Nocardioides sp.]